MKTDENRKARANSKRIPVSLFVAVAAALLVSAACSSEEPADAEGTPVTLAESQAESDSVAAPSADAEAATGSGGEGLEGAELEAYVAARYQQYWEAFDTARGAPSASPDTDYPDLFSLAAGQQLDQTYADIIQLHDDGQAIREAEEPAIDGTDAAAEHRVKVVSIESSVAELAGCVVNDDELYILSSGDPLGNDGVRTIESTSTMAKTDGEWKLIRSQAVAIDDGVAGCWLDDSFQ